jgi:hypothetical protein
MLSNCSYCWYKTNCCVPKIRICYSVWTVYFLWINYGTLINLGARINKNSLFTESGCVSLQFLKGGQVVESYKGAVVKFLCNPGYSLFGSSFMYCNGSVWNGTIPECKGDVYFELNITVRSFKMNVLKIFSQICCLLNSLIFTLLHCLSVAWQWTVCQMQYCYILKVIN